MTTFAAFVTLIQGEINDTDSAMKTRIEGWTNDLHFRICSSKRWQWLVTTSSATLINAANHPYALTTLNPRAILDVLDIDSDPDRPLLPSSEDAIRTSLSQYSSSTGYPEWFYVQSGAKLGLHPMPDAAGRNYTIRYIAQPTILATGATTPLLVPDRWIEVLKDAVLSKAYQWLDKVNKAQLHEGMFQEGLRVMKQQDGEDIQIIYKGQMTRPDIFPEEIVYP